MRHLTLITAALLFIPGHLLAQEWRWTYGDWAVQVKVHQTQWGYTHSCRAWTGGGDYPSVTVGVVSGEQGPPYRYPVPVVFETENIVGYYGMAMEQGYSVIYNIDGAAVFHSSAEAGMTERGVQFARSEIGAYDARASLRAMRAGRRMHVSTTNGYGEIREVINASLIGFTAAYGKMMDSCGYSLAP